MALIIDLKPGERVVIGQALIANDGPRTRLAIKGEVPILREKDILKPEDALTPCQKLYLTLQLLYLGGDGKTLTPAYFELARAIQAAAPSTAPFLLRINEKMIEGAYFRALKEAKTLLQHEVKLISHV